MITRKKLLMETKEAAGFTAASFRGTIFQFLN